MKRNVLFTLPALMLIMMVSCQKEITDPSLDGTYNGGSGSGGSGSSGSKDITGTWKFISLSAITQSTAQVSQAGDVLKTITNTDYTTNDNTGTIVINSTTMATTGMSYSINDTAFALTYENNVLIDSTAAPFSFSLPSYSSTTTYKLIGADSISFTGASSPAVSGGSGAHYTLSGNILKFTTSVIKDTTINAGGIIETQHSTATAVTTLQRQ